MNNSRNRKRTATNVPLASRRKPQASSAEEKSAVVIYCDGAGCGPDGKGSGFAWVRPDTGEKHVEQLDGLTNNQAEYRAVLAAVDTLSEGSAAQLLTDSQLICFQITGKYKVYQPELAQLLSEVHALIRKKSLKIDFQWIPRERNLAGKLV
jgi:ribonuclease HI